MAVAATDLVIHDVRYDVTLEEVAKLGERFKGLSAATAEGYEEVRLAIADLRGIRSRIEARRVDLKRDALEYGRKVDKVAHQLTEAIEVIEQPLKVMKGRVDDEKARIKAEREAAERAEAEAKARAEREAQEATARAAREAEEARLRDERATLEKEKAAAAAERERQEAANRAEQERIAAARAELEAEKRKLDEQKEQAARAEFERQARITAEREATERVERERVERERSAAEAARLAEQERVRLEAMRPDVEKVLSFGRALLAVDVPEVVDEQAKRQLEGACSDLNDLVETMERWAGRHQPSNAGT